STYFHSDSPSLHDALPIYRLSFGEWVLKGLVEHSRMTMFTDVTYTPIHVYHLSDAISRVAANRVVGLFHATGRTLLSKFEFAARSEEHTSELQSRFDLVCR